MPDSDAQIEPTVAIIGGTLWGNRGAEAMLVTTIGKIRELAPAAKIIVYSYYPTVDRNLCSDRSITILDGRPLSLVLKLFIPGLLDYLLRLIGLRLPSGALGTEARLLRRSTVLLDIGGIVFADGRLVFLLYNIFTIWPAMLFDVPVVKLSQALGPFRSATNSFLGKLFLSRCTKIFARGVDSFNFLAGLELSTNTISRASDIVFSYSSKYSLTDENTDRVRALIEELKAASRPIAAIIPSALLYSKHDSEREEYIAMLMKVASLFDDRGFDLLILPNATREGSEKKRNNDLIVVNELRSRISVAPFSGKAYFVDFDLNTASIKGSLLHAQALMTSRFHGMVAGLSLGVPTGVIGWGHKYREVLSEFELEELAADYRSSPDEVVRIATRLIDERGIIREKIAAKLPAVKSSSAAQFDYLTTVLSDTRQTR